MRRRRQVRSERSEWRSTSHQHDPAIVRSLLEMYDFEMWPRVRADGGAYERHGGRVADEQRRLRLAIGGDELRGFQVVDEALQPDVERLQPLHAAESVAPVG